MCANLKCNKKYQINTVGEDNFYKTRAYYKQISRNV